MASLSPPTPPAIPGLNVSGTLPPFVGTGTPTFATMSPYVTTLLESAQRFGGSPARASIFRGLLAYRHTLATLGFVQGFQWLSGSVTEDIERLEGRDPRDVDIVTFCVSPATSAQAEQAMIAANPDVFQPARAKATFRCDPYFVNLTQNPVITVYLTRYWFGLFSHRRGGLWKGLLQVPLAISQDDAHTGSFLNSV